VLGPLELRGVARPVARHAAVELIVYLAMHPRGVANEVWATALWPDRIMSPATLHSTASAARRALGRSASGRDHLPRRHGRLELEPTVGTDWQRFVALASSDDPAEWRSALELVRGRPFDGLRRSDWIVLEGVVAAVEESIVDLVISLAEHYLSVDDGRRAERVARRGLVVSPFDERLYRLLLRAADAQGHPAGVERVMGELVQVVTGEAVGAGSTRRERFAGLATATLIAVHPQTATLYRSLSKRGQRAPGGGIATR